MGREAVCCSIPWDRFAACVGPWPRHPIFLDLTQTQWMRWGYLHADHHLRQFGR